MTLKQRVSCRGLILDTDDLGQGIDGLFMSVWCEMNWFCGEVSAVYVTAAAHNHIWDEWQLAWDSRGETSEEGNLFMLQLLDVACIH